MHARVAATILSVATVVLVLSVSGIARDSTPAETSKVEYKIISARQLGIVIRPDGGVFNYEAATEKLNALAGMGWRYRDFLPTGGNAAFVLERQR